jgi:surfeit locus 1 family protein
VTEDLIETPLVRKLIPVVAGLALIALFVLLALWQLNRASEKMALLELFDQNAAFAETVKFDSLAEFDRIQVDGQFLSDRQILVDNIALDSRQGYYVITPFRTNANRRILLVNRGWIPKGEFKGGAPLIDVDERRRTVRGLAGHLPGVGIRAGEAFEGSTEWPRIAVYPNLDEIAIELEETVLSVVLLMSPDEDGGFARRWQPNVRGPMMHYGYAFQWLAMAAAVLAILIWNLRKWRGRDTKTQ